MTDEPKPQDLTGEQLVSMYRRMRLIRGFEDTAKLLFESGELQGFYHLSQGQEAVPVGTCAALRPEDYITSTHRGHGDVIAKGCEVRRMFAELYGRQDGYCQGKGGSMHIADFSQGIIGANGIVSGGLPIAAGVGLSIKLRRSQQVVVCFFGDGATAEGGFHESLNLASLWQVPVIYVCQNNLYGLSQPFACTARDCDLAERAETYRMPAHSVDGMDAVAVFRAVTEAAGRARAGGGPTFIEAKTYRILGHYVGDPGLYMPEEERESWGRRDCIEGLRRRLFSWGLLTEAEDAALGESVQAELRAGVEFAKASPLPPPEAALDHVYVHFDYLGHPVPSSPR